MALAYYVCFPIVCWKLWFMIASLVYSPLSCGPVRLSAPANRGGLEATEMFNKCLWARGSQVITSSHRRAHKHTPTHRHALHSRLLIFEEDRWLSACPTNVAGFLAWRILPQPIRPPLTFSSHLCWKEQHSSSFLSAIRAAEFLLLSYEMQQELMHKLNPTKG